MRRQCGWGRIGLLILAAAVVTACGGALPAPTFMLAPRSSGSGPPATATAVPAGTAAGATPSAASAATSAAAPVASTLPSVPAPASVGPSASASASTVDSPSPSLLAGGATIAVPGLGLSVRLPAGWVGLDSTASPSIVDSTVARHPDLAESLARLGTGELGFVGFDPASAVPTTPRITIATTGDAIPTSALLEALARKTADQVARTATLSNLEVTPGTLPVGPAVELRYRLRATTSGPDLSVDSWFISAGSHTFLLTFTGPEASGDAWRPQVRAIAESLSAT